MSGLELNEDDCLHGDDDYTLLYMPKSAAIDVEYFTELTTGELNSLNNITIPTEALPRIDERLTSINGLRLNDTDYFCDYCGSYHLDLSSSYYCYDCNKDMCNLCFSETSAEIAEQNGAMNYHLRENDLRECRNHDLCRSIDRRQAFCDICENQIPLMYPEHYYLEGEDYDVCGACYVNGNNVRNKDDLIKIDGDIKFGSLYDWIEIFSDSDGNAVLCNLNPNSNYYKKSAFLAVDDHGRSGYYISDNMDISRLIDEYKEFSQENPDEENPQENPQENSDEENPQENSNEENPQENSNEENPQENSDEENPQENSDEENPQENSDEENPQENPEDETSHSDDADECCAIHSMMIKRHMRVYFG